MTTANDRIQRTGIYTQINLPKVATGSFYTEKETWLTLPVDSFIKNALSLGTKIVLDPYAGDGHLLKLAEKNIAFRQQGLTSKGTKVISTIAS